MKRAGEVSVYIDKESLCYECECDLEERSSWLVVGFI